jgi:hypothetical protein
MTTIKASKGIEALIEEAIERGEFANLQGKGKPLNLDAYFTAPEDLRVGFSVLKSAGFLPDEVELRAEIHALGEKRQAAGDECERRAISRTIQDKNLRLSLLLERFQRRSGRK